MRAISSFTQSLFPLLLLCAALTFAACESEAPDEGTTVEDVTDPDVDDGGDDGLLGARELYEGYNPYVGRTVTVSGEVSETYGAGAFMIGEDLWTDGLLVVVPAGVTFSGTAPGDLPVSSFADLGREYVVQVTGTVRQFAQAELEAEYGLDLDPRLETEIENQEPLLVASSVNVMTEDAAEETADDDM